MCSTVLDERGHVSDDRRRLFSGHLHGLLIIYVVRERFLMIDSVSLVGQTLGALRFYLAYLLSSDRSHPRGVVHPVHQARRREKEDERDDWGSADILEDCETGAIHTSGQTLVVRRLDNGTVDDLRNPHCRARQDQLETKVLNLRALGEEFGKEDPKQRREDGSSNVLQHLKDVEFGTVLEADRTVLVDTEQTPEGDECHEGVAGDRPLAQGERESGEEVEEGGGADDGGDCADDTVGCVLD